MSDNDNNISNIMTKTEFAVAQGWAKSYVSNLIRQNRMVLTEDGRVMVAESRALIAATIKQPQMLKNMESETSVRGDSRDRKSFYEAESARLDLEERIGLLLEKNHVISVVAEASSILRQRLTSRSAVLSPQIAAVGGDEALIKTMLSDHDDQTLAEISRIFAKLSEEPA